MVDLYHATREELIRMVVAQRMAHEDLERRCADQARQLDELRAMVAKLTAQLGAATSERGDAGGGRGKPTGVPGIKTTEAEERTAAPRRKRNKGFGRKRMEATRREIHALDHCPGCGAPLAGGTIKRSREVIDLAAPRVEVTEHIYLERCCPDCRRRCVPPPELGRVVGGQARFGHRLVSLVTVLREEARLPLAVIQQVVRSLTGLHVSAGAIVDMIQRVATAAEPVIGRIAAGIRASPVVHADETGWREAGRNGYVWTFSTPQQRLFVRGSRARAMLTETMGETFAGVLVSDFYAAYTGYEGMHQFCWAHLLRDIADLETQHPADQTLHGWATAVAAIFAQARTGASGALPDRRQVRTTAETDLRHLCAPWLQSDAPQRGLCQRMLRHLDSLFVFVTEPAVPPTNNAAERSLRHLVVSRKISGGTRSIHGTKTKMTLATLFGTWRAQSINPFTACQELLTNPQM